MDPDLKPPASRTIRNKYSLFNQYSLCQFYCSSQNWEVGCCCNKHLKLWEWLWNWVGYRLEKILGACQKKPTLQWRDFQRQFWWRLRQEKKKKALEKPPIFLEKNVNNHVENVGRNMNSKSHFDELSLQQKGETCYWKWEEKWFLVSTGRNPG